MDLQKYIIERIESKKNDYAEYNFTHTESCALNAFFDLAQELENIEDFCILCVNIPKIFFNLNARLYLIEPKLGELILVSKTEYDEYKLRASLPSYIKPHDHPYYVNNSLILPIRGKKFLLDQLPFKAKNHMLGLLEIYKIDSLNPHQQFFLEKYANRIGFNLHNRFLSEKNIEHLKFIRTLVADIEHNVIAPNIVYRLFLKQLRKKIMKNIEIEELLSRYLIKDADKESLLDEIYENNRGLIEELENIERHYQSMSLFIEALLRRSHFDKGCLTLLKKPCNMKKDIVQPQIDRFIKKFNKMGISIDDQFSGIPEEDVICVVDVGLMAQVYVNFFSNALKYTREIVTNTGEKKKYIAYGREVIKDYFGHGKDGIKYNVFSTGTHISLEERNIIFQDGYRGSNVTNRPGTGHGLAFIKNVVEMHGGSVGYEPTQYGNNFFFILPK
ncbi:MAG: ATP-binding protein [Nitrospirota bacterium]